MDPASVLVWILPPLLTAAIIVLWLIAVLDILRHASRGTAPAGSLLCMAGLVSLVAAGAVFGIGAVLGGRWTEDALKPTLARLEAESPPSTHVFSFGLENASYGSPPGQPEPVPSRPSTGSPLPGATTC